MTIHSPRRFREAPAAGFDGVFDWDFILPAFRPTNIKPMDFDGVVERGGQFLVFETKAHEGCEVPRGQKLTLEAAVRTGFFTVVFLYGKTLRDVDTVGWFDIWRTTTKGEFTTEHVVGGSAEVVDFTRRWFEWASQRQI